LHSLEIRIKFHSIILFVIRIFRKSFLLDSRRILYSHKMPTSKRGVYATSWILTRKLIRI